MRIYKYTLPLAPNDDEDSDEAPVHRTAKVELPKNAEILRVLVSGGKVRVFALVAAESEVEELTFEVWPTGVEIPGVEEKEYHATFIAHQGKAFHVYQNMG
jgi:hypothetical protein